MADTAGRGRRLVHQLQLLREYITTASEMGETAAADSAAAEGEDTAGQ